LDTSPYFRITMAILNRFTRDITRGSLKRYAAYAVGEVVLIFAGITLSIWFSNWNEHKKDLQIEINILKEFRQGLVGDYDDVQFNIQMREKAKAACVRILTLMANPSQYHDSLDHYFSTSLLSTTTVVKTSAYENLKSRGLHTITDDAVRAKIIDLYNLSYEHIHESERRHGDLFFNFLVEFNANRFNSTNPYGVMKPLNYPRLAMDKEYKYYLNVLIFYNDYILRESRSISKQITDLMGSIDKEIASLE
jgi:hypothetical protein